MNKFFIRKNASAYTDVAGSLVASPVDYVAAGIPSIVGTAHGSFTELDDPVKELQHMQGDRAMAMLPGVTGSRLARRERLIHKLLEVENKPGRIPLHIHRRLSLLNPLNAVALPIAGLAAAVTSGHTPNERRSDLSDDNRVLKTWLIPGYGTYQYYKDLGLSNRIGYADDVIDKLTRKGRYKEAEQYAKLVRGK